MTDPHFTPYLEGVFTFRPTERVCSSDLGTICATSAVISRRPVNKIVWKQRRYRLERYPAIPRQKAECLRPSARRRASAIKISPHVKGSLTEQRGLFVSDTEFVDEIGRTS